MRIFLVLAPPWDNAFPSIGVPYVSAALKAAGHEVRFRDGNIEAWTAFKDRLAAAWQAFEVWEPGPYEQHLAEDLDPFLHALADEVAAAQPEAVGFSFMGTNHHPTRRLIAMVRERLPKARMFGGGHGMTEKIGEEWVGRGDLDAAVLSEGERSAVELIAAWSDGRPEPIASVVQRDEQGRARVGDARPLGPLAKLPVPDFSDLRFELYEYAGLYELEGSLPVLTSRGCSYRCAFCSEAASFERYRFRNAESVLEEMRAQATKHGTRRFLFMDSLINGKHSELNRLVELLNQEKHDYRWGGQARLDGKLSEALIADMARAGCRFLVFGFESGSQKVLDAMLKHVDIREARRIIRDCGKHGIQVHLNVIVGHPNEGTLDFLRTLTTLFRVRRSIAGISAFRLRMHVSSPMYLAPDEHGVVLGNDVAALESERWRLSDDWTNTAGTNTPTVRMRRYRILLAFLRRLKIPTVSEVNGMSAVPV